MRKLKRLLAFSLALVTLFFAISPSLAQPVQAVAAIDDAVLAVGLLFMTWAGVTFPTNKACRDAVTSFLSSSAAGLEACTNVATNYIVDGSLALVTEVQDIFSSVLSPLHDFFITPEDSFTGALAGSIPVGVPIEPGMAFSHDSVVKSGVVFSAIGSSGAVYEIVYNPSNKYYGGYKILDGRKTSLFAQPCYPLSTDKPVSVGFGTRVVNDIPKLSFELTILRKNGTYQVEKCSICPLSENLSFTATSDNSTTFTRDSTIDGTQIQEITFVPGGVWEPSPDDPTEPSQPLIPFLPMDPWNTPITVGQDATLGANAPGLHPSAVLQDLKQLLEDFQNGSGIGGSTGGGTGESTGTDTQGGDLGQKYDADWKGVFPFCVPFDLIDFLSILSATPQAPKFTWRFYVPNVVDQNIEIDLSMFDPVAEIVRTMELLAFCIGLILLTRNIIRG